MLVFYVYIFNVFYFITLYCRDLNDFGYVEKYSIDKSFGVHMEDFNRQLKFLAEDNGVDFFSVRTLCSTMLQLIYVLI
jgi:hypothetical protein